MGLFDFLKNKKEPELHYDPVDITVNALEKGYLFDYDLETWTVTKMSEYDWGNNFFTRLFVVQSNGKKRYLHIEEDEELIISISEDIKIRKLGVEVLSAIERNGKPPKEIIFKGVQYFLDKEAPGYYRDVATEDWEEFISFDYTDDTEKKCLCIEQWGEDDFEASFGEFIPSYKISDILPAS